MKDDLPYGWTEALLGIKETNQTHASQGNSFDECGKNSCCKYA
jgi:hypothetical protein